MSGPLLSVTDLRVDVRTRRGLLPVLDGIDLTVESGGLLGIAGESGSGKSMLCRALVGALGRYGAAITRGRIEFLGVDLATAEESYWRTVRGAQIGFIPQSSLAGLNPILTIGAQLREVVSLVPGCASRGRPLELLEMVRIPRAPRVLAMRSHELSGGMRQRVMIALALAREPRLLIADEPTTALDVTVQRGIMRLLLQLRRDLEMAVIIVSHNLAVLDSMCERILVMYAGASAEVGVPSRLSLRPAHPYTRALRLSRIDTVPPRSVLKTIQGEPVMPGRWPSGCRFAPRCQLAIAECRTGEQPRMKPVALSEDHLSACLRATDVPGIDDAVA